MFYYVALKKLRVILQIFYLEMHCKNIFGLDGFGHFPDILGVHNSLNLHQKYL
jgi:hypothetical protein